ncbi:hypothetical protein WR25_14129 [Diploscapter pachys]|uniref:Uncharacterized protein n=1 Tax=Diploscapter pachys TaxID=2018661 RepID=A0A2A2M4R6_9BILA|nr:hypothetical protein WR25_14129 [Diploscapter pachys]
MGLFSRQVGMKMALAGMVVMPWGTLGLATVIGALLAHVPAQELGSHSALVSAPVFLCLAAVALGLAGVRTQCCMRSTAGSGRRPRVCWPGLQWPRSAWVSPGRGAGHWCAGRRRHGLTWRCWR